MAMQIGDLIRMKREEHGLTQEQLAELIGKSAGYIGQLEPVQKFIQDSIRTAFHKKHS